jgi:CxxC motif-containing protein (DUF1111 family)
MQYRLTLLLALVLASGMALAQESIAVRPDLTAEDLARVRSVTAPTSDFSAPESFEASSAGAATTRKIVNADAFSFSQANLTFEQEEQFKLGNALFRKVWVSAPSSTQASDGLGPLFNARACQSCHIKDGRGPVSSRFLRLSVPARNAEEQAMLDSGERLEIGDPVYGIQLQDQAVPGLAGEAKKDVTITDVPVTLGDGTVVTLKSPHYAVVDPAYGPLAPDVMLSPRVAPPMVGLGLIESIPAQDIEALADPEDRDGDGISGRAHFVRDPVSGNMMLGRFGWKGGAPSLRVQAANAFAGDIGISTPLTMRAYGDCTEAQTACRAMPTGVQDRLGDSEAPDPVLDLVTFYSSTLGVPVRRGVDDPVVLQGKQAFYESGCIGCHNPKFVTSRDAPNPAHTFQLIWPYSDFLLHDMGDGLADHRPEGQATGMEWRTPALWGIGLTGTVGGETSFLHDGRAGSLVEAILWHGGEAQAARDRFANLPVAARDAMVEFLESL